MLSAFISVCFTFVFNFVFDCNLYHSFGSDRGVKLHTARTLGWENQTADDHLNLKCLLRKKSFAEPNIDPSCFITPKRCCRAQQTRRVFESVCIYIYGWNIYEKMNASMCYFCLCCHADWLRRTFRRGLANWDNRSEISALSACAETDLGKV